MDIDQTTLEKIKTALRITHDALDDDLMDTAVACLTDLGVCGVRNPGEQEMDPLILTAVKLYCRADYTEDPDKAARYRECYDTLKSCLMMSTGYIEEAADE